MENFSSQIDKVILQNRLSGRLQISGYIFDVLPDAQDYAKHD